MYLDDLTVSHSILDSIEQVDSTIRKKRRRSENLLIENKSFGNRREERPLLRTISHVLRKNVSEFQSDNCTKLCLRRLTSMHRPVLVGVAIGSTLSLGESLRKRLQTPVGIPPRSPPLAEPTTLEMVAFFFRVGTRISKQVLQKIVRLPGAVVDLATIPFQNASGTADYERLFGKFEMVLSRLRDVTAERDAAVEVMTDLAAERVGRRWRSTGI